MLVIAKRGLAADNIQEEDGGVVSADKVIRWEGVGVVSADKVTRTGIAVSIFSANVIRWKAMSVVSADNIIR